MDTKKRNMYIAITCALILIIGGVFLFNKKSRDDDKSASANNSNSINSSTKGDKLSSQNKGLRDPLIVSEDFFNSIYKEDLELFKSNVSQTIIDNIIKYYNDNVKTDSETITDDEILSKGIASTNKYLKEKISENWIDDAKFDVYNEQDNVKSVEILFSNNKKLFFSVEDSAENQSLISTSMGFTNYIYEVELWFTLSNMS